MTKTILVVDDSDVSRQLIASLLKQSGRYRVELACDGKEALDHLTKSQPDLVVTDLVMPNVDGLALLRAMRHEYPHIPVILLTAHGNELIAVEAMQSGAASYVPKTQQAQRLGDAVERVLHRAEAEKQSDRLNRCTLEHQWRVSLTNDPQLVRAFVDRVQSMMANMAFADSIERIRIGEALEEALLNAMYHGNLELSEAELQKARSDVRTHPDSPIEQRRRDPAFRDRTILAIAHLSPEKARFVIRDEGKGFHVGAVTEINPELAFDHGKRRGLTLMQSVMDAVVFNSSGNELTMSKHLRKQHATPIGGH